MTVQNYITLTMLLIVVAIAMIDNRKLQVAGAVLVYVMLALLIILQILGVK